MISQTNLNKSVIAAIKDIFVKVFIIFIVFRIKFILIYIRCYIDNN